MGQLVVNAVEKNCAKSIEDLDWLTSAVCNAHRYFITQPHPCTTQPNVRCMQVINGDVKLNINLNGVRHSIKKEIFILQ